MAYNHAMLLAFTVISNKEDGSDITPEMLRQGVIRRAANLDVEQTWEEACLPPYDTYEEDGVALLVPKTKSTDPVLYCKECDQIQFETPSGMVCFNGHGGVEGYTK